ncbi:MAG: twin-arginine translocase TatA/TatE family subunit [Rubrobacter sp.]|nr:twin-arginine translocase TatA/TatE family subunit [Rubrobacter sp.]
MIFGAKRVPEFGRSHGRNMKEFRRGISAAAYNNGLRELLMRRSSDRQEMGHLTDVHPPPLWSY